MQEIPTVQQPIPPPPSQKLPRSRKRLWLIISIIAVLLVIGASLAALGGQKKTTSSNTQPTQQVTTQPTQPPTTQPIKVQPRIMGSIADFDAAYGEPYKIMTDQEMQANRIHQYADRQAYYKIGNSHLLVASAAGTVMAIAGPKSVDYKQYFPVGMNAAHGPDEQTATTDIYNVYWGTTVIGKLEVDDNTEPWLLSYTPTNVFPPQ